MFIIAVIINYYPPPSLSVVYSRARTGIWVLMFFLSALITGNDTFSFILSQMYAEGLL